MLEYGTFTDLMRRMGQKLPADEKLREQTRYSYHQENSDQDDDDGGQGNGKSFGELMDSSKEKTRE